MQLITASATDFRSIDPARSAFYRKRTASTPDCSDRFADRDSRDRTRLAARRAAAAEQLRTLDQTSGA
jgi:hypothetical protein